MPHFPFNPQQYGPEVAALLVEERLMPLGPGSPDNSVRATLAGLETSPACRAGLWLYFDLLHESHEISQELENPDGNFWHAIMHRREPDASNSKYWWRRVGKHLVLESLREQAPLIGYSYTTPEAFVDYCESVRDSGSREEELARRVQLLEWQLLFDCCHRQAIG